MHSISAALPGFFSQRTRAPWPVWRGSVAGPVRFVPLSRKLTAKLWHKARQWDRETHQPGQHGGCVGVDCPADGGSVFEIAIPLAAAGQREEETVS